MSSISQKLDATTPTGMAREAIPQVRDESARTHVLLTLQSWEKRLASHCARLATGRQGASLQQVMDDLRD